MSEPAPVTNQLVRRRGGCMRGEPLVANSLMRRYTAVILFVGIWMALGWLLRVDANAYLLLGVPLTVLFQLLVHRQSLLALWVRGAPPFRLGWKGLLIALGLCVIPLLELVSAPAAAEVLGVLFNLLCLVASFSAHYPLLP